MVLTEQQHKAPAVLASLVLHALALTLFIFFNISKEMNMQAKGISDISVRLVSAGNENDVKRTENKRPDAMKWLPAKTVERKMPERQKQKTDDTKRYAEDIRQKNSEWSEADNSSNAATIIYQPAPIVPDDLRKEAAHDLALVRFHVSADGTAATEVLKPAYNTRLNNILLETLKKWKFLPATENGKPIASQFDIRIHFSVE